MSQVTNHGEKSGFLPQFRSIALVAVGSNLPSRVGQPLQTIHSAVSRMSASGLLIRNQSAYFQTPCFPAGIGPDYVNGAFVIESDHSAPKILEILHQIETEFDRAREQRWGQRTLDLDLLALDDLITPDADTVQKWIDLEVDIQKIRAPDELILPHPRMQDRAFVLVPLMDVAPDWVHPVLKRSVREMHDALPKQDKDAVKRLVN